MLRNIFTGKFYRVTHHALLRWKERSQIGDDMAESFGRALPFGAQVGSGMMFLDGETVFVTTADDGGRCIVTVLSRAQATVNMQNLLYGAASPRVLAPELVKSGEVAEMIPAILADVKEQLEEITGPRIVGKIELPPIKMPDIDGLLNDNCYKLRKLSDEALATLLKECSDMSQQNKGRITKEQRKKLGTALFYIGQENRHRKMSKHAQRMERRYKALKDVLRQTYGEETAIELFKQAQVLEETSQNPTSNQLNTAIE